MENIYGPAIEGLKRQLDDAERRAIEIRNAINLLCESAGMALIYPKAQLSNIDTANAPISHISADTFYGKRLQTAVREYLGIRKTQNLGPAKPKEIYDSLIAGGFKFDVKDPNNAIIGIRALLRKRYNIFHKLDNGTYGLVAWYPNIKTTKSKLPAANASENTSADPQNDEESADE